jgi:primosomal protein N' (replication factor Y)
MKGMHYYEVAPNQIIRADSSVFTYAYDQPLQPGHIVMIEVGRKNYSGLVMREVTKPPYNTKNITKLVESTPIPLELVRLAEWMASYYGSHLATVLQTVLPRGVQKSRRDKENGQKQTPSLIRDRTKIVFTTDQKQALQTINAIPFGSILLHGVTGSGKTAVYIEAAKDTLAAGKSVIVLVPEIALTSQLVDEFAAHFSNIVLTHSRQTEAERHRAWLRALTATEPTIVIGPRSALFMPVSNLGLIVIDEAHEPSFKQEQSPRYSALRAASILTDHTHAKLILGSATPLVSDYYVALKTDRPLISLPNRAMKGAVKPTITLVDMTKRLGFKQHRFLSDKLLAVMTQTLTEGHQVLIFHNRRGSANTTLCENCGWSASCPRCFLPMTLHADNHQLRCHVCGQTAKVPTSCPVCHSTDIIHKGIGTKLIESELHKLFPDKVIARFDGDSSADGTVEARYKELYEGTIDIIVGTQVIAKGLDLPKLRAVGVIQADAGLSLPDFAAPERTFQLLAQVVGRVGRSHHPTDVIVQSYQPSNYAVIDGLHQDYRHFYETALTERKRATFPPFTFLLKLTCIYKTEAAAIRQSQTLARILRQHAPKSVEVLGPTPAFYERQRDSYRWQLTLKSPKRADLVALLAYLPPTHWQFELDPTSLL